MLLVSENSLFGWLIVEICRTGYGQHADYVFGWKDDSLQKAMDAPTGCVAAICPALKTQSFETANKCLIEKKINEDVNGCKFKHCPAYFGLHADSSFRVCPDSGHWHGEVKWLFSDFQGSKLEEVTVGTLYLRTQTLLGRGVARRALRANQG